MIGRRTKYKLKTVAIDVYSRPYSSGEVRELSYWSHPPLALYMYVNPVNRIALSLISLPNTDKHLILSNSYGIRHILDKIS
jgi:hypothetical protein